MTMTKHLKWKVAIQPLFEEVILNKENAYKLSLHM